MSARRVDAQKRYTYGHSHTSTSSYWYILDMEQKPWPGREVFTVPFMQGDFDLDEPPVELRAEYERLIGWKPGSELPPALNVVEMLAGDDDSGFDRPCAFGFRVEQYAVYCHNKSWLYAPSKCPRCSETGVGHEDCRPHASCPGFRINALRKGA